MCVSRLTFGIELLAFGCCHWAFTSLRFFVFSCSLQCKGGVSQIVQQHHSHISYMLYKTYASHIRNITCPYVSLSFLVPCNVRKSYRKCFNNLIDTYHIYYTKHIQAICEKSNIVNMLNNFERLYKTNAPKYKTIVAVTGYSYYLSVLLTIRYLLPNSSMASFG